MNQQSTNLSQNDYLELIEQAQKVNQELDVCQDIGSDLNYLKEHIENFSITVPVIGKFSSGKSTLLNQFMSVDFLKEDIRPETSISTELHFSNNEKLVLRNLDNSVKTLAITSLNDIEVDENLYYTEMHLNNESLARFPRLTLVDMPGFDSNNQSHHKAISRYIERGDAFICLLPDQISFDNSIMTQIEEIECMNGKPVYCFISKVDKLVPSKIESIKNTLSDQIETLDGQARKIGTLSSIKPNKEGITDFSERLTEIDEQFDCFIKNRFSVNLLSTINGLQLKVKSLKDYANSNEADLQTEIAQLEEKYKQAEKEVLNGLDQMQHNLCSTGKEDLIRQIDQVLNSALERLVDAAQSNNIAATITMLLRPIIQTALSGLIQSEISKLDRRLSNISLNEYQSSLSINISTQLKDAFIEQVPTIVAALTVFLPKVLAGIINSVVSVITSIFSDPKKQAIEAQQQAQSSIQNQVIPQASSDAAMHITKELQQSADKIRTEVLNSFEQEKVNHREKLQRLQKQMNNDKAQYQQKMQAYEQAFEQLEQIKQQFPADAQQNLMEQK